MRLEVDEGGLEREGADHRGDYEGGVEARGIAWGGTAWQSRGERCWGRGTGEVAPDFVEGEVAGVEEEVHHREGRLPRQLVAEGVGRFPSSPITRSHANLDLRARLQVGNEALALELLRQRLKAVVINTQN